MGRISLSMKAAALDLGIEIPVEGSTDHSESKDDAASTADAKQASEASEANEDASKKDAE